MTLSPRRSPPDIYGDLDLIEERLRRLEMRLVAEDWHYVGDAGEPAFENSWVNYDDTGATQTRVAFYRDPLGVVRLKGLCKNGTDGATIFTLPAGYRPPATDLRFPVITDSAIAFSVVSGDGAVSATGSVVLLDLSSISFRAEQ